MKILKLNKGHWSWCGSDRLTAKRAHAVLFQSNERITLDFSSCNAYSVYYYFIGRLCFQTGCQHKLPTAVHLREVESLHSDLQNQAPVSDWLNEAEDINQWGVNEDCLPANRRTQKWFPELPTSKKCLTFLIRFIERAEILIDNEKSQCHLSNGWESFYSRVQAASQNKIFIQSG